MNYSVLLKQIGLKSSGYDPGPLDGKDGNKTKDAMAKFVANYELIPSKETVPGIQTKRWNQATLVKSAAAELIVKRIEANQKRYQSVSKDSGVPWFIIACLHNMEASGDFSKHLHEGSPLTGRTKYVPKGRPLTGKPPFTWEESALDALKYDGLHKVNWNSLEDLLYAVERYNGTGYLKYHKDVPSPYLWAGTSIEVPGKYVSDGSWSSTAVSKQIGVAAILKLMVSKNLITL